MNRPYQQIDVTYVGDVVCVSLRHRRLEEAGIHVLGNELLDLIEQGGCRRLVLSLGPGMLDCLYSIFLAKLVMIQHRLGDRQGVMILCDVKPEVMTVFEACKIEDYFTFAPDGSAALAALDRKPVP